MRKTVSPSRVKNTWRLRQEDGKFECLGCGKLFNSGPAATMHYKRTHLNMKLASDRYYKKPCRNFSKLT